MKEKGKKVLRTLTDEVTFRGPHDLRGKASKDEYVEILERLATYD